MRKLIGLFALLTFVGLQICFAQMREITGTVVDKKDRTPLPGVSVVVKGNPSTGVATDINGKFTLKVNDEDVLVFSFIGMKPQEVAVKGQTNIHVEMELTSEALDEVVVTGYGIQRKASFTGAASMVGQDVIAKKNDANFIKALEGSMPGVQMNNSTGIPGAWGAVYVRGRGSLNSGTQPLYVVDGIPVNSDYESMSDDNNYLDPMSSINPADIENVTVLKDAAATAIYGARAANGVIVITTKKGIQGKFNINLDIKQGFVSMGNHNMDFANADETMNLFADGYVARYGGSWQNAYDYLADNYFEWDRKSSYDWVDKITRKGYYQDYNINIQGGTGATNYYFSLGYLDTEGLVLGSDMKRYSGRLNVNSQFKVFSFGASVSYSNSEQNGFSQSTGGSMSSPMVAAISSMNPFYPFYNEDGSYANINSYNPLALTDKEKGEVQEVTNQTINVSPYLQVDFGKGIYAKTTFGVNIMDQREYSYWSAIYNPQGMDYNGLGQQYNTKNTVLTWNNILGWNYIFDKKHNINLMVGQEMQRKNRFHDYYSGADFPFADAGMRELSTAGTWFDSEYNKSEARLASYFTDIHYSYNDKYYISGSFRRDGSSVFGSNKRWGNFWSVGAKWRMSGEEFLKNNSILTNTTLRASYGTVGNQDIGWYAARGFYVAGYNYGGTPGMVPTSISNPNLTWEVSKKFDIGFDLSFINRFHLTFDYYNEKTEDALFQVPLSMTTGIAQTYQNIGAIKNQGIELSVNASILQDTELKWNVYANMTWNKNEVLKLSTPDPIEDNYTIIEEGRPYRQFYMKEYAGVERETGKPLWYLHEEGNETTSDYNTASKRYVGSADPKVLGGFGTNLNWKGLDFSTTFNYRLGGKVFDSGASFTGFGMTFRTPLKDVARNSWTEDNKDAKYPQYIYGDPNKATQRSTRFLYSGNFLRVSNMTLGYTLPSEWTKRIFIQKFRAYVSVDNLYTFTANDFVGYNPETYASGFIAWQYPSTRTFIGGIQITF